MRTRWLVLVTLITLSVPQTILADPQTLTSAEVGVIISDIPGEVPFVQSSVALSTCTNHRIYFDPENKYLMALFLSANMQDKYLGIRYEDEAPTEAVTDWGNITCKVINAWRHWNQ